MKKITYSFLSILMLLLAMPLGALARTTVTFDFTANPWGLPLSSSKTGEVDKGAITSPILQDGVTLTTTDGTNKTKMWVTNSAIDLRVYKSGGTFTFTAPANKVIEKIEFAGTVAATADAGTCEGSSKTWVWVQPKNQVNAVKFTATATNKIEKAVLTIADPGEEAEVVVLPEITDFASLKACEKDKAVKLTVTNYGEVTDVAVFKEAYEAALAAAKAAVSDDTYAEVVGDERTALTAAIDANSTVAEETKEAYIAATTALNEATNTFKGAKESYVALATAKAQYKDFDVAAYKYASEEKASALADALVATAKNAEEATAKASALVAAVRSIVESNALAEGVEGATNYTESIKNANAEALDGWTIALGEINKGAIKVLNNEPFTDAEGNSTHSYFDGGSWNDNAWDVTFSQDVTLPKGKYLLTATSRASADLTSFALFAGEARAEMKHVGASGELFDRGWNDNSVEFGVTEDDAVVNLGVQGVTDKQHQWMSFTRFRLVKVGEVAPAYTEVNSIAELRAIKVESKWDEVPVKINLHDAKITALHKNSDYGMEMIDFAILEDATGAISISDLMMEATAEGLLEGNFEEGSVLNGTLYATYNWPNSLCASEDTEKSQITPTPSTVVPTEATLAEVIKPENDLRLFKLQDVTIKNVGTEETPDFDICQGEASIELRDAFALWFSDGSNMPEKLQSVTGILYAEYESLEQETPKYFFTPLSYEAAPAAPIEVNSIAELNKLGEENEGATIKLKLTDAQITVADASMSSAIIEDKTGAFNAQYFFAEAVGTEMLKDEFKQGSVLNGDLYCLYSYPGSIEVSEENTAKSQITVTEAPVVPTEADFAEVLKAENNFRLYEFKGITVNKNVSDKFQLVKGDAKAEIADRTHSLDESMMANVESVVGYFRIAGDEAEFTLLSYKTATPDGISALEVAAKNAAVYNLNGAKVLGAGESVKGLAKGIYVVGGKKIVVK